MGLQEGVTVVVFCASNPISTYVLSWAAVKTGVSCVFAGVSGFTFPFIFIFILDFLEGSEIDVCLPFRLSIWDLL